MPDFAASATGGTVHMVTSLDPTHPGESAIDGVGGTFWITTGLYPQELIVKLGQPAALSGFSLRCARVRHLRLEACVEDSPVNFKPLAETFLEDLQHRPQEWRGAVEVQEKPTRFVKLTILAGWDDVCAVGALCAEGTAARVEASLATGSRLRPPASPLPVGQQGREEAVVQGGLWPPEPPVAAAAADEHWHSEELPRELPSEFEGGGRLRRSVTDVDLGTNSTSTLSVKIPPRSARADKVHGEPDAPKAPDTWSTWE